MRTSTDAFIAALRFVWKHPANRHARLRAMCRFVAWQVWERLVRRPRTITMPGGLLLRLHPHSTSASAVLYTGFPEWEDMRFVFDALRPGDVFVDVGANVGVYSLFAAATTGTTAYAFEPSTETFPRLEENIRLNNLEGRIRCIRSAVGNEEGTVRFLRGHDTVNRVAGTDEVDDAYEEVPIQRVDNALDDQDLARVAIMKIDVEGLEPDVLRGSEALLSFGPALIVEANEPKLVRGILEPLGYVPVRYEPDRKRLIAGAWERGSGNNLLFVTDVDAFNTRIASSGA